MVYCKTCGKDIYECMAERMLNPTKSHQVERFNQEYKVVMMTQEEYDKFQDYKGPKTFTEAVKKNDKCCELEKRVRALEDRLRN